jgi:DNA-binding NarL/FixJ family response regulator
MKLLLIQENDAMCRLIRSLIEGLPYQISECRNSAQALAALIAIEPEWVVLDLDSGQADGLELVRQIALACPQTRVMILTDDDQPRLRTAAERAGVCDYVLKENLLEVRRLLRSPNNQPF